MNPNNGTLLPTGSAWIDAPETFAGSVVNVARSPYDGSHTNPAPNEPISDSWATYNYFSVGPESANYTNNPAILGFDKSKTSFSFLWGSVDDYNLIEFWDSVGLVFTLDFEDPALDGNVQLGIGAALVTVSDLIFNSIRFHSSTNALEFANMRATPAPIPPALLLFGTALVGLGYLARRRRQSTGPALAA